VSNFKYEDNIKNKNKYVAGTAGALKNPLSLKTSAGAVLSPDHPPPRRRETYRRSIHMLNFTYEDNIKNKYVAGTI
jgi:hypothetical protein